MNRESVTAFGTRYIQYADASERQHLADFRRILDNAGALSLPGNMEKHFALYLKMYLYNSWPLERTLRSAEDGISKSLWLAADK